MGSLVRSAVAFLLTSQLALLFFGVSSVLGQELRERDGLCNEDGCFVVYFQRKTFLESWKACKVNGGNLATIKRQEDATSIASLFSTLDLRDSRTKVQVWIGLQRQPRQCAPEHPLRGFSWTTGDHDTQYTNWQQEDSPQCSASRCVAMSYSNTDQKANNFKWLDTSCLLAVHGYLCHYAYKGMCPAVWNEGPGDVLYTTPFNLVSTLLTHVPFGSVAAVSCPEGTKEKQSVSCMLKEDGHVGWSRDFPVCTDPPLTTHIWCEQDNGGCEHLCRMAGVQFYCECYDGFQLGGNGQSCESDVCRGAPCESECLPMTDGYRCACPEGYMLAPDERACLDVDECLQSPCEQLCVNSPGSFQCQCREGYQPDDESGCEDVDECTDEPCEHACENTPGSHICHCHLGYSPVPDDTSQCQDTDECQIPGTCEQMCGNYQGGFDCFCEEGYQLMSDEFSCHKRGEGDDQSAVTPPFPGITHRPGLGWDYGWNPNPSHTDWPPDQEDPSLDWLTDPPRVFDSDVIWVTSAPQEELALGLAPDPEAEEDEKYIDNGGGVNDWGQSSLLELEVLPTTVYPTTAPAATSSSTDSGWYDDEEESTTAPPFLPTSTISEGASNWWVGDTTASHGPREPEDSVMDQNQDHSDHNEPEEQYPILENTSKFPEKELSEEEKDHNVEITHPQDPAIPTKLSPSQSPPGKGGKSGDIPDSVPGDSGQNQSNTWLLVGLLVPFCIFIVVMVVLGIIYCTRCAAQPRNKDSTDCYHWISGAHDKGGAPNPSTGVKTHV